MQDRATFSKRSLSALVSLAFSLCMVSMAHADESPKLPNKITDSKTVLSESRLPASEDTHDLASLKSLLKVEILQELRSDKSFSSQQTSKPKLNFLELAGYFRTRADLLSHCDLGTYMPSLGRGTSQCAPPVSYFTTPLSDSVTPSTLLFSSDVRFRLDPTLNVSEDIRIRGRFDILDNLVLGSTPNYMTGLAQPNPSSPFAVLSPSQNSPLQDVNSRFGPMAIKRLWAEVTFPYGDFRFGRMPFAWGLGIMHNAGDDISQDFGNNVDGVFFDTRIGGFQFTPGFTISYTGPTGRGGGLGAGGDNKLRWFTAEEGQRYDLDPSDNVYNFHLSFARKDCESDIKSFLDDNRVVWNYGILGTYRFQLKDTLYSALDNNTSVPDLRLAQYERNAHLGLMSLWSKLLAGDFVLEVEAAGIFGQIGNGERLWDIVGTTTPIWIYQGGVALESRYGFLQNRLQIGLDAGWASGDPAPGFGIRSGINKAPAAGASDGQQFAGADSAITNFAFAKDYHVDLMLFREVLGTVTDAFYLKPHVAYFFTENVGLRGDVVGSMSNFATSTPGNDNFLGVELDASAFFKTSDGFVLNLQYGYLFPFGGLNHTIANVSNASFREARAGSALRILAGVSF